MCISNKLKIRRELKIRTEQFNFEYLLDYLEVKSRFVSFKHISWRNVKRTQKNKEILFGFKVLWHNSVVHQEWKGQKLCYLWLFYFVICIGKEYVLCDFSLTLWFVVICLLTCNQTKLLHSRYLYLD